MRLRWLTCLLLLLSSFATARAQIGIYGKLDLTNLTQSNGANRDSTWLYGPGVGAYYDFLHLGPVSAGVDLRGDLQWGNNYRFRSGLVGLRLAAHAPLLPLRPYVQGSIGAGGTRYTGPLSVTLSPPGYTNKFEYAVLGGLDSTILPRLDLRLVEIGYGSMAGIANGNPVPNSTLVTVSTGVVFRLP